jgi:hypothetical protein
VGQINPFCASFAPIKKAAFKGSLFVDRGWFCQFFESRKRFTWQSYAQLERNA